MDHSDKIKSFSEKLAVSLLKSENPMDLETFKSLTEAQKKHILKSITDESAIETRLALLKKLDQQKAWGNIRRSEKQKSRVKTLRWLSVAASIVLFFGITIFLTKNNDLQTMDPIIVDNNIEIGTDKAMLTLENGSDVILEKGIPFQMANANSDGEQIIYKAGEVFSGKAAYHYLTIPRGGQYQVELSDGTLVWLNSESQLKYPVAFNDGETRQVELVYGEAYFDVSPSTEHKGAKFKVFHKSQEVEVLGTEFNIKAYKDETKIYTTLVEGKVAVNTETINKVLKPGEQSNLNVQENTISVTAVDIYNEVSWKEGVFSFRGKSLEDLMKVLGRWYDMEVVFENEAHKKIRFKGVLRKQQSIEEVMSIIQSTSINNYTIHNKTITIQ
ncbi:MAG: FecR domain-containing protein [Algibacter sp.]